MLGAMYLTGDSGVDKDLDKAFKWVREAARQGDADSMHHLGLFYSKGDGVARSFKKAAYWLRKAAERGIVDAQFNLGAYMCAHVSNTCRHGGAYTQPG